MNKAELERKLEEQQVQITSLQCALDVEQECWTRLALEKNALIDMLQTLFHFHVFCKAFEEDVLLWDVEDTLTGNEIVHHEMDVIKAYKKAILFRLPETYML